MAGDVIFDQSGKIFFVYASQYPSDRPSVIEMIEVLQKMKV